jgi:hypothetical protein
MHLRDLILTALALAPVAFAQGPATTLTTLDAFYQVRYIANLQFGDSYIDMVNDGATMLGPIGPGGALVTGNICANVYVFDSAEEMISCCSCLITPDGLMSLSVQRDILSNTATGVMPTSLTVKLLATIAGIHGSSTSCTNSASMVSTSIIGFGLAAWGTTLHATPVAGIYATTETAFTPATLSAGELASLGNRCSNIIGDLSGFGICASCRATALGGSKIN